MLPCVRAAAVVLFFASCCGCKLSPNKINPPLCNPSTCFDLVALASFSPCCELLILSRRSARFGHERRWGGRLRCGGAIASMAMVAVNDGVEAAAGNVLVRLRRPCWSRRAMAQRRWSLRGLRAEAFPAETRSPRSPSMVPAPSWGLRAVRVPPGPGHGNVLCLSGGYRNGDGGHVCTRVGRTNRLQPKLELCSTSLRRLPMRHQDATNASFFCSLAHMEVTKHLPAFGLTADISRSWFSDLTLVDVASITRVR
ncbi:hypothetical protein PAHAL_4G188400 [Panicum hallii]|jgi:hypothetical protein|uniref:Secreted protein n=1 Tax=Panicum hallii TaxID=206008 RepID=A0A2T8JDD1_9POAL|nr:hypothetical protein PAHAL_4G188400 [Panicum hallii]